MAETGIPYCDVTWDLTLGCRKRSPGCDNCWALPSLARIAGRFPDGPADKAIEHRLAGCVDSIGRLCWSQTPREIRRALNVKVTSKIEEFAANCRIQQRPWN